MRYTRLEIPCKLLNFKSNIFLKFFLIIPLMSIILGSICVKFVIRPYISEHKGQVTPNVSKSTKKSTNIPVINNMYFLQAGIFSSEGNARMLVDTMKKNGFSSFVVEDKSKYRVVVNFSDDKKLLTNEMDKLKQMGYATIVNTVNIQTIDDNTKQEFNTVKDYLKYINNVIRIQYNAIKQNDTKKNGYNDDLKGIVSELNKTLNDIKGSNPESQLVKKVLDFNVVFMSKYEQYVKNLEDKNINAASKNLIEGTFAVAELCRYMDQIK